MVLLHGTDLTPPAVPGLHVHELTLDLTGAESVDDVLERVIDPLEDLVGTVWLTLQGPLAALLVECVEEIASLSSPQLEIVVRVDTPERRLRPVVAPEAEPPKAAVVDLRGLTVTELEDHLAALAASPVTLDAEVIRRVAWLEEQDAARRVPRARTWVQGAAVFATIASGVTLVAMGSGILDRVLPAVAVVIGLVVAWATRSQPGESPELAVAREHARADLLRGWRLNGEISEARHAACHVLDRAGLPTDVEALEQLLEAAAGASGTPAEQGRAAQVAPPLTSVLVPVR